MNEGRVTYSTTLSLRDEHKHELVLVHPRADPEDNRRRNDHKRREWGEEQANSSHEQLSMTSVDDLVGPASQTYHVGAGAHVKSAHTHRAPEKQTY